MRIAIFGAAGRTGLPVGRRDHERPTITDE